MLPIYQVSGPLNSLYFLNNNAGYVRTYFSLVAYFTDALYTCWLSIHKHKSEIGRLDGVGQIGKDQEETATENCSALSYSQ